MTRVAGGISSSRATGLAATAEWQPSAMWHPMRPTRLLLQKDYIGGFVGGEPGLASSRSAYMRASLADASTALPHPQTAADDRKTVVTNSFNLIVKSPQESSQEIRQIADHEGGFLVSAENYGAQENSSGSLTIRVPAARFEQVRAEIRKLGLRVESEKLEAQDVTKQTWMTLRACEISARKRRSISES